MARKLSSSQVPLVHGGVAAGRVAAASQRHRHPFSKARAGRAAALSAVTLLVLLPCSHLHGGDGVELLASNDLCPTVRAGLVRAHALALDRVRSLSSCRAMFASLGADGETCLAGTVYLAAKGHAEDRLCRSNVMAFTVVGSAVTRVCPWFAKMDDEHAAMILLHEALHRAGLDEWPHDPDGLTPQGITDMVTAACGLGAARREVSVVVAALEELPAEAATAVTQTR